MKNGLVDNLVSSIGQGKRAQRGQFNNGPMIPYLELTIERAPQGGRRCRQCAAVCGRYFCQPSTAVRREWRHTETGMDLIVDLLQREPACDARLRALILVEKEGHVHARAVYSSEPLSAELLDGPWLLKLISEESECDFVFPVHVEIGSSGKLPAPGEKRTHAASSAVVERYVGRLR
jgi:hypothetical protein